MPGSKRCEPGCACEKHNRPRMSPDEKRQRAAENQRRYRAARPEHYRTYGRERARNELPLRRERDRRRHPLKRVAKYGLSLAAYARLLEEQDGRCYLCLEVLPEGRNVHIDHDHSCCPGAKSCGVCVRGLACMSCNNGIGQFGDDPGRMVQVAKRLALANEFVKLRRKFAAVQDELPIEFQRTTGKEESALWQWKDSAGFSTSSRSRPGRR